MIIGLKKQEPTSYLEKPRILNQYQYIESTLLVDSIVSGQYTKHSSDFFYLDTSEDSYTSSCLAKLHPSATFHFHPLQPSNIRETLEQLNDTLPNKGIHYMHLGKSISFCNVLDRRLLYSFIHEKLAPGGYVIIPYEAKAGWTEYLVVLDLLKEICLNALELTNNTWIDKIFHELTELSLKKISTFKNKAFLDKLLKYLKSLPPIHLQKILSSNLYTFYPYEIHNDLNITSKNNFRFVGSLPTLKNYVRLGLDENQKAFLGTPTNLLMASQRHDLILMPFQRIDIWQKSQQKNPIQGTISDFYFGCISKFEYFPPRVTKGHLNLRFSDPIYIKIRQLLNKDFLTLDEIIQNTSELKKSPQEIVDCLMSLVIGEQIRYTLKKPKAYNVVAFSKNYKTKLKFRSKENQLMFSNIKRFYTELGIVTHPESGLMIPFDQKTSMIISALTKLNDELAPQYCAEIWAEHSAVNVNITHVQKEFRSIALFFKHHYVGKFLELGVLDQVLVE